MKEVAHEKCALASRIPHATNSSSSSKIPMGWKAAFQGAFDQAAIGMALVGLDGAWLCVNSALCEIVGYSEQELLETNFQQITHPGDLSADLNYVAQMVRGEIRSYQMEKRYLAKDGHTVFVLLSVSLVYRDKSEPLFFFSQIQDITARKCAEERLHETEKLVYALLNNSPNPVFLKDTEGRYLLVNKNFERVLRVSEEQIRGKKDEEVFPSEQAAAFRSNDLQVLQAGVPLQFEEVALHEDGPHTSIVHKFPLFDADGKLYATGGISTDITERKRVEDALRRSEARYREMVENTSYGVYHATRNGRFLDVNPALVTMLGYSSKDALLAVSLADGIYHNLEDRARLIDQVLRTGRVMKAEVEWKRKDGKPITVRISGRALYDEAGELAGTEGIIENLTEWRELEKQFRQAQKMEAVGRLAGGVAHDFNNLLTIIKGNNDLLSDHVEQSEPHRSSIEQIRKASDRAVSLTRQLLAFSRMQVLEPRVLNLNAVVAELSKMLPRLISENIELVFAPDQALGQVKADPGQVEQVIMNLAVNARDAMPEGGKLVVETTNFTMDDEYVRRHPAALPGQYVMLAVTDTGHGMGTATLNHIFEPFFTTKELGKGTGLGLATVYGIVKQSGGFIWVYSEPGKGTTFKIYLPRVDEPVEPMQPSKNGVTAARGTETILLVEDEEALRELVGQFLRKNGYTVLEAKNGVEGLLIAERQSGSIHLLMTDVVMPKMGGWELAKRLVVQRPGLKVVYMSGYSEYTATPRQNEEWRETFVQKPFTMAVLARKVRDALERQDRTRL